MAEVLHYTDAMGPVDSTSFQLVGRFLSNAGLERVPQKMRYLTKREAPPSLFRQLREGIGDSMTLDQFSRPYRSHLQLVGGYSELWERFQGAVSEALAEIFVEPSEQGVILISNHQLDSTLRDLRLPGVLVSNRPEYDFMYNRRSHSFFDAARVELSRTGSSARVDTVFEFKSTSTDYGTSDKLKAMRWLFTDPDSRWVMRQTIAKLLNLRIPSIELPHRNRLIVQRVAAQIGIQGESPDEDYDYTLPMELPSIRNFAIFVLELLSGNIPRQEDWRAYFSQISPEEAILLNQLRLERTSHSRKRENRRAGKFRS